MVTLRQLRYLEALAGTLNFRRAAAACHVTQPALTAQIRELEERLGVQLVERSTHKVLLTAAGRQVTDRAVAILRQVDELCEAASRFGRRLTGPLHLGVIPTIAPYLLPEFLPLVRRRYPELKLYLREDRTPRLLEALLQGRLELLLLALPVEGPGLECMPLFDEPFVLATAEQHPLAHRPAVQEQDLRGESVLLLEEEHCLREQALAVCQLAGASEAAGLQATSLNTLVQMVGNGLGFTLLPEMAVPVEVRSGSGVAVRRFTDPAPSRRIGLAWRRASSRADEYRELGELMAAQRRDTGAQTSPSGMPSASAR